jgi:hypothetical protein
MPHEIRYSNRAIEQLKNLRAVDRTAILDAILSKRDSLDYLEDRHD